jgi:hypothetical protein
MPDSLSFCDEINNNTFKSVFPKIYYYHERRVG